MYKLIVDKIIMEDFYKIVEYLNIKAEEFTKESYMFLSQNSRTIVDSIFGGDLCPVRTIVTIRTDLTNEVIVPNKGRFYTDCTASYPNEHPLDDTIMLAAKSLVDKLFDCGKNLPNVMLRTTLYPVGACIIDDQVYVYINVVIDHTLKNDPMFKLRDCHFESIKTLSTTSPLEAKFKKSLAIVERR